MGQSKVKYKEKYDSLLRGLLSVVVGQWVWREGGANDVIAVFTE